MLHSQLGHFQKLTPNVPSANVGANISPLVSNPLLEPAEPKTNWPPLPKTSSEPIFHNKKNLDDDDLFDDDDETSTWHPTQKTLSIFIQKSVKHGLTGSKGNSGRRSTVQFGSNKSMKSGLSRLNTLTSQKTNASKFSQAPSISDNLP